MCMKDGHVGSYGHPADLSIGGMKPGADRAREPYRRHRRGSRCDATHGEKGHSGYTMANVAPSCEGGANTRQCAGSDELQKLRGRRDSKVKSPLQPCREEDADRNTENHERSPIEGVEITEEDYPSERQGRLRQGEAVGITVNS